MTLSQFNVSHKAQPVLAISQNACSHSKENLSNCRRQKPCTRFFFPITLPLQLPPSLFPSGLSLSLSICLFLTFLGDQPIPYVHKWTLPNSYQGRFKFVIVEGQKLESNFRKKREWFLMKFIKSPLIETSISFNEPGLYQVRVILDTRLQAKTYLGGLWGQEIDWSVLQVAKGKRENI